jgi:cbb3-type cytochrome oxidase subunit 3
MDVRETEEDAACVFRPDDYAIAVPLPPEETVDFPVSTNVTSISTPPDTIWRRVAAWAGLHNHAHDAGDGPCAEWDVDQWVSVVRCIVAWLLVVLLLFVLARVLWLVWQRVRAETHAPSAHAPVPIERRVLNAMIASRLY